MSTSPPPSAVPSTKRPLEDPSSPSGPTDQPDAKRPALDKVVKADDDSPIKPEPEASVPAPSSSADVKTEPAPQTSENGTNDTQGDIVVPDAPNGTVASYGQGVLDTQPIQSMASYNDRRSHTPSQHQGHQDETGWIHVRAVISSAEAATVIGKGGENVSQIRRLSGAKCTVSDYSRGAVERILTVSGLQDAVAKVSLT